MTQQALGTEKYEVWCAPRGYEPGALTRCCVVDGIEVGPRRPSSLQQMQVSRFLPRPVYQCKLRQYVKIKR